MFRDQRRSDRAAGTYGRGLSPQEKLALGAKPQGRPGDQLVLVKCEARDLSPNGKSIAVWLGECDGNGDEVWQWLPNKCVTPAEGGVLIPQWLAEKEGLMP